MSRRSTTTPGPTSASSGAVVKQSGSMHVGVVGLLKVTPLNRDECPGTAGTGGE